jgi:hypothetical protein
MADSKLRGPSEMDFSNSQKSWPEWKRRFLRYRSASGLDEKAAQRQVDTLIYMMGEEAETIYEQLTVRVPRAADPGNNIDAEDDDGTLFDRTVEAFDAYFVPRDNHLHYAVMLGSRSQLPGETNEQFIRNLHELAAKCTNWNQEHRNDMLRTRLLAGMRDKELSRELQLNADITLNQIKQQLRTKEIIAKNQQLELDEGKYVDLVSQPSRGNKTQKTDEMVRDCKYCGLVHVKGRCPAYNKDCRKCGKRGHFSRVCNGNKKPQVNQVEANQSDSSHDGDAYDVFYVNSIDKPLTVGFSSKVSKNEWLLEINVLRKCIQTKVDNRCTSQYSV